MTTTLSDARAKADAYRDQTIRLLALHPERAKEVYELLSLGMAIGQVYGQMTILEGAVKDLIPSGIAGRLMQQVADLVAAHEEEMKSVADPPLPSP
jgi:hypothetical protein